MKKVFPTAVLTLLTVLLFSQESIIKSFTLNEAVDYAITSNVAMKNARLGEDQAKARNWEIMSTGLPTVSAELGYTYYFKQPVSPAFNKFFSDPSNSMTQIFTFLAQQYPRINEIMQEAATQDSKFSFVLPHNVNSSLSVSQLIFDGRYFIGLKATKDFTKTARLQRDLSQQDVKYNVMKAYYQAVAASEGASLLGNNLKPIQKLLSDTRALFQEGLIEELDVDRLSLAEAQLQSQITLQMQLAKVATDNLKFQMGMSLTDEIILKDNLEELRAQMSVDAEAKFDVSQRTEKDLLETAIRIRGYDVAQRRSGYFPSMFAFLNYGWQAQADKFDDIFKSTEIPGTGKKQTQWFDQGLVGITLKIPIFDSGSRMSNVKQAKIDKMKTENDLENFRNAAELQFRSSRNAFESALIDEANNKRSSELSEKIFKTNQIKYTEGIGNSFELVQSETDNATNQLKRVQSILNLLNAKADLDKAMGVK